MSPLLAVCPHPQPSQDPPPGPFPSEAAAFDTAARLTNFATVQHGAQLSVPGFSKARLRACSVLNFDRGFAAVGSHALLLDIASSCFWALCLLKKYVLLVIKLEIQMYSDPAFSTSENPPLISPWQTRWSLAGQLINLTKKHP